MAPRHPFQTQGRIPMKPWRLPPHIMLLLPAVLVLVAVVILPLMLSFWSSLTPFRLTRPDSI